jgi:hypothetical protein
MRKLINFIAAIGAMIFYGTVMIVGTIIDLITHRGNDE